MPDLPPHSQKILDALNEGQYDEPPPPTWLVMQFGVGPRPNVACSTSFRLASANFLQQLRAIAILFPDADFRMRGINSDASLRGLSLYQDGRLALTLQPVGGIVTHPIHPDTSALDEGADFERLSRELLAGIAKRKSLPPDSRAPYRHSSIANSWQEDVDEPSAGLYVSEPDVRDVLASGRAEIAWDTVLAAHTMVSYLGTVELDDPSDDEEEDDSDVPPEICEGLAFKACGPTERLPTKFDPETGTASKFQLGYPVVLSFLSVEVEESVDATIDALDQLLDQLFPQDQRCELSDSERADIMLDVVEWLESCPCAIDAYAAFAGICLSAGTYELGLSFAEPAATELLALLPEDGNYVQVSYYELNNRPFHRLMLNYLLLLAKVGRDADANFIASQMLLLCPSDNLGFRFLKSKAARQKAGDLPSST